MSDGHSRAITDLSFGLSGRFVPVEHAQVLYEQVVRVLPWIDDEPGAGIHQIHVAASGNGWVRPEEDAAGVLALARRTRLTLRVPLGRVADAGALAGVELCLAAHRVRVGAPKERALRPARTIFARHVAGARAADEEGFTAELRDAMRDAAIEVQDMVCGRLHSLHAPDGPLVTRSVMLDGCSPAVSMRLQELGIGPARALGCGLFMPHKAIGRSPGPMDD